ncbi:hypothetical protein E1B28_012932 [Marasmius oreades]|uniref:Uncharacterized protein n=1 Tax=Marasmius oreades TaxID=181124 RepID=A0A9P7RTL1_9AGAR|nr:uncharacterized protein E1B28_012932 [Marasmius oreades]KAG7088986.1 hypothetical protein E1B28_012932 [Marasmius oreades]
MSTLSRRSWSGSGTCHTITPLAASVYSFNFWPPLPFFSDNRHGGPKHPLEASDAVRCHDTDSRTKALLLRSLMISVQGTSHPKTLRETIQRNPILIRRI